MEQLPAKEADGCPSQLRPEREKSRLPCPLSARNHTYLSSVNPDTFLSIVTTGRRSSAGQAAARLYLFVCRVFIRRIQTGAQDAPLLLSSQSPMIMPAAEGETGRQENLLPYPCEVQLSGVGAAVVATMVRLAHGALSGRAQGDAL